MRNANDKMFKCSVANIDDSHFFIPSFTFLISFISDFSFKNYFWRINILIGVPVNVQFSRILFSRKRR